MLFHGLLLQVKTLQDFAQAIQDPTGNGILFRVSWNMVTREPGNHAGGPPGSSTSMNRPASRVIVGQNLMIENELVAV